MDTGKTRKIHTVLFFRCFFGNSAENLAELDKHLAELAKDFITVS